MSDRHIEILAEEFNKRSDSFDRQSTIWNIEKGVISITCSEALTAMQRVEEEVTPKTENELMAFMLTNIIRMSDEKRSEFIRDLFIRYSELNPLKECETIVRELASFKPSNYCQATSICLSWVRKNI